VTNVPGGDFVTGEVAADWAEREPFTPAEAGQLEDAADQAARRRTGKGAKLDAELEATNEATTKLRNAFYVLVLLAALVGQATGAVEVLGIPAWLAVCCVAVLEFGGMVLMRMAEIRRRLGETAVVPMILAFAVGAFAVTFNWVAHEDRKAGAFFAFMSGLGFCVWVLSTEHRRRDRLRANGQMSELPPQYELVTHWLRRPMLTLRARSMAKADPKLGMVRSLVAADQAMRRDRRLKGIARVLRRKIRKAVDPVTADIAINAYDLDRVADDLAARADYTGLSDLVAADLVPSRIAAHQTVKVESIVHRPPDEDMVRDIVRDEVRDALSGQLAGHIAAIETAVQVATERLEAAAIYAANRMPELAATLATQTATPAANGGRHVAGEVADDPANTAATVGREVAADQDEEAANQAATDEPETVLGNANENHSEQHEQVDDRPPKPRPERPRDRNGTGAKVAAAIRRNPTITTAELATRFRIPERTARRHAAVARATNGHDHGVGQ